MASDDQANPFDQPGHWPRLRQGPIRLGPLPKAAPWPSGASQDPAPVAEPQAEMQEVAVAAPVHVRAPSELDDADLAIPAPAPRATEMPFEAPRARVPMRRPSRLIPVLAAAAIGLAGVGLLAYLMNAGQRASAPALTPPAALPAPVAVARPRPVPERAPEPTFEPTVQAVAPKPAPTTPTKTAAAKPPTRRIEAPAPQKLDLPAPDPAPLRIDIPPPTAAQPAAAQPAAAQPAAAILAPRAHPGDPDAPISTNTPN